jgi:purine nucleosidase
MATSVVLVHDAAIDEYMSAVLLTALAPQLDLRAAVVMNADCIAGPAMQCGWQVMEYVGHAYDIPTGLSAARSFNAFPWSYRSDCVKMQGVPALAGVPQNPDWPPFPDGDDLLYKTVSTTPGITVLVTSPMTPVAMLLERLGPEAASIGQVVWMGGAVYCGGNLDPDTLPTPPCNALAEWNAFCDPYAVQAVFDACRTYGIPLTVVPLDLTNKVPLGPLMQLLAGQQQYRLSQLAYQAYELVSAEPFYDMWDVATTAALAVPSLFDPPRTLTLAIEAEIGAYQGTIWALDGVGPVDAAKPESPRSLGPGVRAQVYFDFANGNATPYYAWVAGLLRA